MKIAPSAIEMVRPPVSHSRKSTSTQHPLSEGTREQHSPSEHKQVASDHVVSSVTVTTGASLPAFQPELKQAASDGVVITLTPSFGAALYTPVETTFSDGKHSYATSVPLNGDYSLYALDQHRHPIAMEQEYTQIFPNDVKQHIVVTTNDARVPKLKHKNKLMSLSEHRQSQ